MEYSIQQLAALAGVSRRTLRHYDQIGLLCPARTEAGYRRYTTREVDRLQQILFYRSMGFPLEEVGRILDDDAFDALAALQQHLEKLEQQQKQLEKLAATARKTIRALKGEVEMNDKEKFEGFKQEQIQNNEAAYGEEIRQKYGDEEVDAANVKFGSLTKGQYDAMQQTEKELFEVLKQATAEGDPDGTLAQKAAALHRAWLGHTWPQYSAEAHRGLAQMYRADQRFSSYYEKAAHGAAAFLCDAIEQYAAE